MWLGGGSKENRLLEGVCFVRVYVCVSFVSCVGLDAPFLPLSLLPNALAKYSRLLRVFVFVSLHYIAYFFYSGGLTCVMIIISFLFISVSYRIVSSLFLLFFLAKKLFFLLIFFFCFGDTLIPHLI